MTPTQKIVAFIDGSIYAQSVCHHAAWIADRTGAAVDLIHVLGPRDTSGKRDHSGAISLGARTALLQELAELDAQRSKLMSQRGRAILGWCTDFRKPMGVLIGGNQSTNTQ